jgi:carboxyl-terminal processing protease
VGETTVGKGTVQRWRLLSGDSGGFRLSVAKWLTPDKTWVHGVGITPDVVVEPGAPDGADVQLDRALGIVLEALGGAPSPPVLVGPSPSPSAVPSHAPFGSPAAS